MIQPTLFIPHGGGPCFFMDDPAGNWTGMGAFLRGLESQFTEAPEAILVISGHWLTRGISLTGSIAPSLIYDYAGFPEHTYELRYDAPGAPLLAREVASALSEAGLPGKVDPDRGIDHGAWVPLKLAFPKAQIPVVEMSLDSGLEPELHLALGRALAPFRARGVAIVATGMSFHNMRGYGDPRFTAPSRDFDQWLTETLGLPAAQRDAGLMRWESAPAARLAHPQAEHFLPVMVAAGAATTPGRKIYSQEVLKTVISGFRFD